MSAAHSSFSATRMAWRNVWRNRRRSGITIAAVTFALATMTLYSGLVQGYLRDLERSVLDYEVGDMQVFAPGYRDKPSLYASIENADAIVSALSKAGFKASGRMLAGGLGASSETSAGISIRGIDVASDALVSRVGQQVAEGAWLDPKAPSEVVIGRKLAKVLGLGNGGELVILTQGADGSTANRVYKIRGILKGISDATDRSGVFMTQEAFRDLLVYEGGVHQILVRRPDGSVLEPASVTAREIIRKAGGPDGDKLDVATWKQLQPMLAQLLQSTQGVLYVTFSLVYIAIGIVILNAMLMAVFERIRELGMLKAIGMGPLTVMWVVVLESSFQTAIAIAIGLAIGIPGVWWLSVHGIDQGALGGASVNGIVRDQIWRASFTTQAFVAPLITLLVIVGCAILYPALKAARLRPVEAMRHQ